MQLSINNISKFRNLLSNRHIESLKSSVSTAWICVDKWLRGDSINHIREFLREGDRVINKSRPTNTRTKPISIEPVSVQATNLSPDFSDVQQLDFQQSIEIKNWIEYTIRINEIKGKYSPKVCSAVRKVANNIADPEKLTILRSVIKTNEFAEMIKHDFYLDDLCNLISIFSLNSEYIKKCNFYINSFGFDTFISVFRSVPNKEGLFSKGVVLKPGGYLSKICSKFYNSKDTYNLKTSKSLFQEIVDQLGFELDCPKGLKALLANTSIHTFTNCFEIKEGKWSLKSNFGGGNEDVVTAYKFAITWLSSVLDYQIMNVQNKVMAFERRVNVMI